MSTNAPHALTDRQRRIVLCAREWIAEHGEAPSVRELGAAVGLTSTSSVAYHLRRLTGTRPGGGDPRPPRRSLPALRAVISPRPDFALKRRRPPPRGGGPLCALCDQAPSGCDVVVSAAVSTHHSTHCERRASGSCGDSGVKTGTPPMCMIARACPSRALKRLCRLRVSESCLPLAQCRSIPRPRREAPAAFGCEAPNRPHGARSGPPANGRGAPLPTKPTQRRGAPLLPALFPTRPVPASAGHPAMHG